MIDDTQLLLREPDITLFRSGGCHVFTLVTKRTFPKYALTVIKIGSSDFHLVCEPEIGAILDVGGWYPTQEQYRVACQRDPGELSFAPTIEEKIRDHFSDVRSDGRYFAQPDFITAASKRAEDWIQRFLRFFDGSEKRPIPENQIPR